MKRFGTLLTANLCLVASGLAALPAAAQTTERVSVDSAGNQGNSDSFHRAISGDGRFVAFTSFASNLVAGGSNGQSHIYVHDRETRQTERVSVDSAGNQLNSASELPTISDNGQFVAFRSGPHIYVQDRTSRQTELVSVNSSGIAANNGSSWPALSADGRFVAFSSNATNLDPADTNGNQDVFVRDRALHQTERVSVDSTGTQANSVSERPAISADGRFIAFYSQATNWSGTNGQPQIYVHDRASRLTELVSRASDGAPGNSTSFTASISADGRFVAFHSQATNLVANDTDNLVTDVFVHDRLSGQTERVSIASDGTQANGASSLASLSRDGRFVAFASQATNLVGTGSNGFEQIYVHDRSTRETEQVSVNNAGEYANSSANWPHISGSGRFVVFYSRANNLVPNDTNNIFDVFVRDRGQVNLAVFGGFEPPVENLPFTNSTQAGRSVPIKWQLIDESGGYIRDLAIVKSLQFTTVACDWQDEAYANPIDGVSAGESGLRYDSVAEHFVYSWDTRQSMRDTCAVFILTLVDNQQHFARFMLK